MDSSGFVWLLSLSSWFCLASTTRLIQIRNGAEHRISFLRLCRSSLHGFFWFCLASFPQLLVLFGFHDSLNTNPKRSGTSDFILNLILLVLYGFSPLLLVLCGFHNLIIQIRSGAEHRISFLLLCRTPAGAVECKLRYQSEYRIRITITT